jgi:putative ABC transport system ATP-binding protein
MNYIDKIKQLQKKCSEMDITSKKKYQDKIALIKQIYELELEQAEEINDKNKKLFDNYTKKFKLGNTFTYKKLKNADDLYGYICFYEKMRKDNCLVLSKSNVAKINNLLLTAELLNFKKDYYENVIFKNKPKFLSKTKFFEKKINYCKTFANDIKINSDLRYYVKMINRLENMKKKEPNIQNGKAIIELKNVTKYYANKYIATKVLGDVDLQINKGEFVVILGPSGSGKTTLLNIISGMDNATYGDVIVANESLINKHGSKLTLFRKKNVGFVFQQYGLLPNLTVKENVEIGSYLQDDKTKRINIDELLKMIGMYEYRNKLPAELSGGQQQRTSIARSVAKNPNILFGDEPTAAVDEATSKQILQLFIDINKKYSCTVILVTHNAKIAELATKVVHVQNGKIKNVVINKKPKHSI